MRNLHARVVTDRDELRAVLRSNPITCAYMLGDLDESYRDFAFWYGASLNEREPLQGVVLVYTALSVPVLISYGMSAAIEAIMARFGPQLPGRALVHLQPHHVAAADGFYGTAGLVPMLRMGLTPARFRPVEDVAWTVEHLTHRHTGDIIGVYEHYPDNFFEPAQLDSGHYYGVFAGDRLVSVSGVHVFSPGERIAVLGNIVTLPGYRGQGMSTACTSHLCRRLFHEGIDTLALNVRRQNRTAVRIYEDLGFRYHDTYFEGILMQSTGYAAGPP